MSKLRGTFQRPAVWLKLSQLVFPGRLAASVIVICGWVGQVQVGMVQGHFQI